MIYKIFAIKDTKVGFMQPFIQPNEDVAIREFHNIVNVGNSIVSANYKDMELYSLGSYNMDNGEITTEVKFLINGVNVKEVESNEKD